MNEMIMLMSDANIFNFSEQCEDPKKDWGEKSECRRFTGVVTAVRAVSLAGCESEKGVKLGEGSNFPAVLIPGEIDEKV